MEKEQTQAAAKPSELNALLGRMRSALDWYAEMAKQMQRATLHGDSQYMLGMMKEMALDGGKRAREATAHHGRSSSPTARARSKP